MTRNQFLDNCSGQNLFLSFINTMSKTMNLHNVSYQDMHKQGAPTHISLSIPFTALDTLSEAGIFTIGVNTTVSVEDVIGHATFYSIGDGVMGSFERELNHA